MKAPRHTAPLAALLLTLPLSAAAQTPRQLFATVVTNAGGPVVDLQPAEFDVRENGLPRRIVRASLANEPMRIALIVDSSDAAEKFLNQFRGGLLAFFEGLPPQTEVALMSIGRQARLRLPPTADRQKLRDAAKGFFADGGGTAALDGVIEGYDRFLKKAEGRWPVLVLITTDGANAGSVREDQLDRFLQTLQTSGVVAHAVVISTRGYGGPTAIALSITQSSGGYYEAIAAATALPDKMKDLAGQLATQFQAGASQYRIEYLSESKDPVPVEVGVTRSGVKLTISDRRRLK